MSNEGAVLQQNDPSIATANTQLDESVTHNLFEVQDQELIESLSRDILVANEIWTPSNLAMSTTMTELEMTSDFKQPTLFDLSFPEALFKSEFIKNKLKNIAYIRADVIATLRVQATPFLQGVLWMYQVPYAKGTSLQRRVLNEHLRSLTTFHGVQLNLQSDSRSAELHLPYVNEFQVINPNDLDGLSELRVAVIAPLDGESDGVRASCSIFARLTNIKLYGMAPSEETEVFTKLDMNMFTNIRTQSGEDEQATKTGIVSRVSNTVADIADAVSGIPTIGAIAKPISWIARAAGKVASFFGFSKPMDLEKTTNICNVPAKGFTNCVGIDSSVSLSILPDNAIDATKTTFSRQDEMSISYLAEREYCLDRYDFSQNSAHGDVIATIPVHPADAYTYGVERNGRTCIFGAPISLVSQIAKWWRGQMKLRLHFAKTQYHQGRLLVQYMPYGSGVQPIESVFSQVIDLAPITSDGIEINFPTIIQNKWLNSLSLGKNGYEHGASGGVVVISVLNELIAPPNVAPAVVIMPWVSWSDFEIAEPGTVAKVASSPAYPIPPMDQTYNRYNKVAKGTQFTLGAPSYVSLVGGQIGFGEAVWIQARDGSNAQYVIGDYLTGDKIRAATVLIPAGDYTYSSTYELDILADLISSEPVDGLDPSEEKIYRLHVTTGSRFLMASEGKCNITSPNSMSTTATIDFVPLFDYDPPNTRTQINTLTLSAGGHVYTGWEGELISNVLLTNVDSIHTQAGEDPALGYQQQDLSVRDTTMGEIVPSLRLLSRRFTLVGRYNTSKLVLPGITFGTDTSLRQSVVDIMSWLYRFTSGSVRMKVLVNNPDTCYITSLSNDKIDNTEGFSPLDANSASHIQNTGLNPILEVSQPFYSPAENLALDSQTFDSSNSSLSSLVMGSVFEQTNDYVVLKAAGDDHTFSCLVGCPAFYVGPLV